MATYTIKNLEQITGIKSPTIRMWEKRYGILSPNRTETNIRYYSEADLKRLININTLIHHGLRISQVAQLKANDFKIQIEKINKSPKADQDLSSFLSALIDSDIDKFGAILNERQNGSDSSDVFIFNIAYPLYDRIKSLWTSNNLSDIQKNMACFVLRKKLYDILNQYETNTTKVGSRFVCFLPENEADETEMLFYLYVLKINNLDYNYIGRIPSPKSLLTFCNPQDSLLTGFSSSICNNYIHNFTTQLKNCGSGKIYLFHPQSISEKHSKLPSDIIEITSLSHFQELIKKS